jgi:hypothetical protein
LASDPDCPRRELPGPELVPQAARPAVLVSAMSRVA